jgi:hypothetical protein
LGSLYEREYCGDIFTYGRKILKFGLRGYIIDSAELLQWPADVNIVINLLVPYIARNVPTS